ncbi:MULTISPECIES: hypothetical protein [unclassified Dyella]|uniref:hypothetical protein n=1 Tax=unclassified Dyella TaxID=2634549 RepID=UPI0011AF5632|nr:MULTISPECIES: hypothetical protein [unclassified Dyella]MDR3443770.1 hypothetical protein [Dyella sp.]
MSPLAFKSLVLNVATVTVMPLSQNQIDNEIRYLAAIVPCMLQPNGSAKYWIEFFDRANAIKDRVPPGQRDWVREKVYDLLARSNLSPPWKKARSGGADTGKVYAFPTGLRIA